MGDEQQSVSQPADSEQPVQASAAEEPQQPPEPVAQEPGGDGTKPGSTWHG